MATIVDELVTVIGFKVDKSSEARAKRSTEGLRTSLAGVAKSAKRVGLAMSAAFAGAAAAATKLTTGFAETADQFAKDSKRLGLGVEALQELKFAAELSGASFENVKVGFRTLSQGLIDATSKGTGPAADAFRELGISLEDPAVAGRDLEGVVSLVAERFAGMEDGATKAAAAQKLFGRSGLELIPMLNAGADGIAGMRQEARDLGGVFSAEAAANAEEFNDTMLRVRSVLEGVRNRIATALLPVLQDAASEILAWAKANKGLIATRAREFVDGLVSAVRAAVPIVKSLVENWQTLAALFAAGKVSSGFASAARGLQSIGVMATGALGPIGAVAAALVALIPVAQNVNRAVSTVSGRRVDRGAAGFVEGDVTAQEAAAREAARSRLIRAEGALDAAGFGGPAAILAQQELNAARAATEKIEADIAARAQTRGAAREKQRADLIARRQDADARAAMKRAQKPSRGGRGGGRKRTSVDDLINRPIGGGAGVGAAPPQVALTVNRFEVNAPITSTVNGVPGTTAREVADTVTTTIARELQATITKAAEAIATREAR